LKIALVQDQLLTRAGSERVFLYIAQEFLEADLYTLCYNPDTTWPEFKTLNIATSALNPLIQDHSRFKALFPVSSIWMEQWDFSAYDLIITSSATTAKYVRKFKCPHICYCYFPTRAIWRYESYFGPARGLLARIFGVLLPWFKKRDMAAAARVSQFIAISQSSAAAIQRFYGHDAAVLQCPIDVKRFAEGAKYARQDYFLLVSRLEQWKQVDYAIEAFTRLGLPLRVIGTGPEEGKLRALAGPGISFLGAVDDEALVRAYGEARAVVFPPELEYGLVPLEANAAGTPVIALGRGGVLETMVDRNDPTGRRPTAILYPDPTAECLMEAVRVFCATDFSRANLMAHVAPFDIPEFRRSLRAMVNEFLATGRLANPAVARQGV
jgi:glycosyltransferase involved in cell wall biosynthesis